MLLMALPSLEVMGGFQLHRNNIHTPYQDIKSSQCSDCNLYLELVSYYTPPVTLGFDMPVYFFNPALDHVLILISVSA